PPEPPDHGLYLRQVLPQGNAFKAGLRTGDVLLRYNGVQLRRFEDLQVVAQGKDLVPVQIWREGQRQDRSVATGPLGIALAKEPAAQAIRRQREAEVILVQRSDRYGPLPGTRLEVQAVGQLFETKWLLLGSQASEQRLDELIAAGELSKYRILHLATHGEMHP